MNGPDVSTALMHATQRQLRGPDLGHDEAAIALAASLG